MENKNFSPVETMQLVKLYCDADWQRKFDNHKKSQKHVWNELSKELEIYEIHRAGEQCQNKIKNLKKEFFKLKRAPTGSGRKDWPYYEDFAKVFGGSALLNPVLIMDSMELPRNDPLASDDREYRLGLADEDDGSVSPSDSVPEDLPSPTSSSHVSNKEALRKEALRKSKENSNKRKTPAQQIYAYLKKSEEDDKRMMDEFKKSDSEMVAEMKKMNENMAELIAVKKHKMEQSPVFHVPYFQPQSPSQASPKQVEPARKKLRKTNS